MTETKPFWRRKRLDQMTRKEWESLCDGCGRCCLHKLRDADEPPDTPNVDYTDIACKLLDTHSCRCTHYPTRRRYVPDCVQLTPKNVDHLGWMPSTCAYRLLSEGHDLYWWHPLVSGDPETVHIAGISVRDKVISEVEVEEDEYEDHIVEWPA
ncbi:YcgN family cysteine cluster protein [Inquilinus sp. CA228]|uniref:YcgN family cysteine cluster protein n=1 Tax=Inquilinus sp. CA228 TaxID=3455609 RepID=UPI003F8D4DFC